MRQTRVRAVAGAALAFAVTACGGGSHTAVSPQTATAQATSAPKTATATFSLLIPNRPTTSGARHALYVSAATQSGTIQVGSNPVVELDLTSGNGACTTVTNGRTCLISVPAPVGSDAFTLALYDGPFISSAHSGNLLSKASYTKTIAEGTANVPIPLVLNGAAFLYTITVTQQPTARQTSGAAAAGAAVLTALDPDSNVIVGPGTYVDTNGNPTGFTISASSSNYQFALNNGAQQNTVHVTSPSDVITITQTHAALGAQLIVTPDGNTQLGSPLAYIRPSGFTANDIESTQISSGATGSQLAPLAGQTYGVGVVPNYGAVGLATTDTGVGSATSCGTGFVRSPDAAANSNGFMWTSSAGYAVTHRFTTCDTNPQFPGVTFFGKGAGVYSTVDPNCYVDYQYGTGSFQILPGSNGPPNCSLPHDFTGSSADNYSAFVETNTSDNGDHIAVFNGQTITIDARLSNIYATAAALSITSIASGANAFYAEEPAAPRFWIVSKTGVSTPGFLPLPGGFTYVGNAFQSSSPTVEWSSRTMAVGSDGLLYVAVSSPSNGVLVIDPTTANEVTLLVNPSPVTNNAVFNVVSDNRGTIYWSAGGYLMHYPSNVSSS